MSLSIAMALAAAQPTMPALQPNPNCTGVFFNMSVVCAPVIPNDKDRGYTREEFERHFGDEPAPAIQAPRRDDFICGEPRGRTADGRITCRPMSTGELLAFPVTAGCLDYIIMAQREWQIPPQCEDIYENMVRDGNTPRLIP